MVRRTKLVYTFPPVAHRHSQTITQSLTRSLPRVAVALFPVLRFFSFLFLFFLFLFLFFFFLPSFSFPPLTFIPTPQLPNANGRSILRSTRSHRRRSRPNNLVANLGASSLCYSLGRILGHGGLDQLSSSSKFCSIVEEAISGIGSKESRGYRYYHQKSRRS